MRLRAGTVQSFKSKTVDIVMIPEVSLGYIFCWRQWEPGNLDVCFGHCYYFSAAEYSDCAGFLISFRSELYSVA